MLKEKANQARHRKRKSARFGFALVMVGLQLMGCSEQSSSEETKSDALSDGSLSYEVVDRKTFEQQVDPSLPRDLLSNTNTLANFANGQSDGRLPTNCQVVENTSDSMFAVLLTMNTGGELLSDPVIMPLLITCDDGFILVTVGPPVTGAPRAIESVAYKMPTDASDLRGTWRTVTRVGDDFEVSEGALLNELVGQDGVPLFGDPNDLDAKPISRGWAELARLYQGNAPHDGEPDSGETSLWGGQHATKVAQQAAPTAEPLCGFIDRTEDNYWKVGGITGMLVAGGGGLVGLTFTDYVTGGLACSCNSTIAAQVSKIVSALLTVGGAALAGYGVIKLGEPVFGTMQNFREAFFDTSLTCPQVIGKMALMAWPIAVAGILGGAISRAVANGVAAPLACWGADAGTSGELALEGQGD